MNDETKTDVSVDAQGSTESSESTGTIEETREELAKMYLLFLDKQKGGILATGANMGVNLNPFQKDAIKYMTSATEEEKTDIFSRISKNIKKKFVEKLTGGTMLEYDKASLNKMRALIMANKDNQAKLQELMAQIAAGTDPTETHITSSTSSSESSSDQAMADVAVVSAVGTGISEGQNMNSVEYQRDDYKYPVVDENGNPIKINSPVGERDPIPGIHEKKHIHKGIDIAASKGTPILAIQDGEVEDVGFGEGGFNGYGNYIVIKLKNGYRVLYAHMKNPAQKKDGTILKVGDNIKKGEQIGEIGSTGKSSGPHLHLEIREGKYQEHPPREYNERKYLDPIKILPVTKDMVNQEVLAHIDKKVLMEKKSV